MSSFITNNNDEDAYDGMDENSSFNSINLQSPVYSPVRACTVNDTGSMPSSHIDSSSNNKSSMSPITRSLGYQRYGEIRHGTVPGIVCCIYVVQHEADPPVNHL